MRILLLGQTGLEVDKFLNGLRRLAKTNNKSLQILDLEGETRRILGKSSPVYIDLNFGKRSDLLRARREAFDSCTSKIKSNVVVLHLHAVYRRRRIPFHVLDWDQARKYKPDMVVTLIENVYRVAESIRENPRAKSDDPSQQIKLKDIMEWRAAELMIGQSLAEHCSVGKHRVRNYVVAKRHGPELIYQLLYESSEAEGKSGKKKIYASFPITKSLKDEDLRREVSNFRERLKHENKWIVFDPWTIDEGSLLTAVEQATKQDEVLTVKDEDEVEHRVSFEEAAEVYADIDAQIPQRDYQLIEPCDALVAYRGGISDGVRDEIQYANQNGIEVFTVWPSSDGDPKAFRGIHITARRDTLDDLLPLIPG